MEELKAVIMVHKQSLKEKDPTEQMRRVTHMTLAQLQAKADSLGIDYPTGTTKGNLMRLIRDSPDQELMKIGKFRGFQFVEIPESYCEWVMRELATATSPDPELVCLRNWYRFRKQKIAEGYTADATTSPYLSGWSSRRADADPSSTARSLRSASPTSSATARSSEWGVVSDKGSRTRRRAHHDTIEEKEMEADIDPKTAAEIAELETRLAISQEYESEAAGREGDVSKDGSYDALRFCDPNLGDSGSQRGGRDRKCCGVTEAVPTISEGEFVQSFVCRHEVLAFDHDNASVSDGADFFDIDDEASEHHDASGLPDDQVLFECRDLTLDDEANFFYDSGDFSFATLLDLLEKFQAKLGKYGTKRASVINPDTEVYCPFKPFVLGGVRGVRRAITENTALVRYLNAFARAHVGREATWSSIIVSKGVHSKVHHDLHNLVGSWNYCASFGHQGGGGELWVATPNISDQEANDQSLIWKNAEPTGWLPGRAHSTEETFAKFDPAVKHAVLPGHEEGWHMVCYTTRGAAELDGNLVKFLKNCGFPMPGRNVGRRETASRRPRKAVRNSIGNMVGKLSVLFTTLLTAASSFLSEAVETRPIYDPIVMFEIGGLDGTVEATDLGKAVMEPMSWEEYSDPDYVEKAYHTVRGATPRELRLHLDKAPDSARENLKDLMWEQLETGGTVVLQGGRPDDLIKDLGDYLIYQSAQDDDSCTVLRAGRSSFRATSYPTKFALSRMKGKVPLLLMNDH